MGTAAFQDRFRWDWQVRLWQYVNMSRRRSGCHDIHCLERFESHVNLDSEHPAGRTLQYQAIGSSVRFSRSCPARARFILRM